MESNNSEIRKYTETLRERIRHVLMNEWDPIGIKDNPDAAYDYDSYVDEVIRQCWNFNPPHVIASYLHHVKTREMGVFDGLFHKNRNIKLADLLIETFKACSKGHQ
jgi:hypothetical protein